MAPIDQLEKCRKPDYRHLGGGSRRCDEMSFLLHTSVRRVFPSTASNGPSMATFDDIPRLKCRPHPPHDPVLYATAVAAPRNTRSPKGLPVREPFGSMWHDPQQLQHVHPEALGSPSGYVVPSGHRLLRPHPPLWIPLHHLWIRGRGCCTQGNRLGVGIQRFPNLLRWTVLACRLPYPGGPEECT
jgi:hypothetical protein